MIFLEYSQFVVEHGLAPAALCYTLKEKPHVFSQLARAERVYSIKNGVVTIMKDRHNGDVAPYRISEADELVLRLRATLI